MSLLGNLIWLIFGGFLTGLGYIVGGLALCLTIVGIPFGVQAIKLGTATMTPFGRKIVEDSNPNSTLKTVLNVVWIILFGWEIALAHLVHAALLAITIIGLPFASQHIKLIALALFPFGRSFQKM
ncbi:YccF domain-containing protein [Thermoleptolyngbya sp.]